MIRKHWPLGLAIAIQLSIRLALLIQQPELSLQGYETLLQVNHIIQEGIPLTQRAVWMGTEFLFLPLAHYLIAFLGIITGPYVATLVMPNIVMATTSIATYLIAKQLTRSKTGIMFATLASTFTPLLYGETLYTADPATIAIPMLLFSFYFFIRLTRTPRDQISFLVAITALTLTHPIVLLLAISFALSLAFSAVQKSTSTRNMGEATLMTMLMSLWALLVVYKEPIESIGLALFTINPTVPLDQLQMLIALVGVIPLVAAAYSAQHFLRSETNTAVHATTALIVTSLMATLLGFINLEIGLLLTSILLVIMIAPATQLLQQAATRSRAPTGYVAAGILLVIFFFATSIVPSVAQATQATLDAPTISELELVEKISGTPQGNILWEPKYSSILEAARMQPLLGNRPIMSPQSLAITNQIDQALNTSRPLVLLEILNEYNVTTIILPENHQIPITQRCYEKIYDEDWKAYKVRCQVR